MKTSMLALVLILSLASGHTQNFIPESGDLLFQDLDCGPLCEAIEAVTPGYKGANLSHMGLVVQQKDTLWVVESVSEGTVLTPLEQFLGRSADSLGNPKVLVGRLKNEYQSLIPGALNFALSKLGTPYDSEYLFEDDKYYCSELIYLSFCDSSNNNTIFQLQPMTFKQPNNQEFFPAWMQYYSNLEIDIPECLPGINPGIMSESNKLTIVYVYGKPDGYTE